jgi:hypothetical protein
MALFRLHVDPDRDTPAARAADNTAASFSPSAVPRRAIEAAMMRIAQGSEAAAAIPLGPLPASAIPFTA